MFDNHHADDVEDADDVYSVEWVESCDRADTCSHQHGQDRLRATEPTVPGEHPPPRDPHVCQHSVGDQYEAALRQARWLVVPPVSSLAQQETIAI